MSKKLWIIAGFSLVFVLLIFAAILRIVKTGEVRPKEPPAITPYAAPSQSKPWPTTSAILLEVVSTTPVHGTTDINLDQVVTISFNRVFSRNEVSFEFLNSSLEKVDYQLSQQNQAAVLTPKKPLQQSTVYTIRVRNQRAEVITEFEFLTLTIAPSPDTRPIAALTQTIINTRRDKPNIFLANLMPYQSYDFAMELEIKPGGYFNFVITSDRLGESLLKSAVEEWLLSLDLTNEQIKDLPLEYR